MSIFWDDEQHHPAKPTSRTAKELCGFEGLQLKCSSGEESELKVRIHADASYGGEEARSQPGVVVTLAYQMVLWYFQRQDTVSLSITEAEDVYCGERGS